VNITILTYGSRGDVQPFLALAVGLKKAGHHVTLAAPYRFVSFIEEYGIPCAPLAGDPDELSILFNDAGGNLYRMLRGMQKHLFSIAPEVVRGARKALAGADFLIHSFAFTTGAHSLAREMGIPDVSVQGFPMFVPTRAFPALGMPVRVPGWMNYASHWMSTQIFWHGGNLGYYQLRRNSPTDFPKKLYWPFRPAPDRAATPLIFAISPVVLSQPLEWNQPHIHVTGYFFLDHPEYQPPEELSRFLKQGDPPVCVTFGSMVNREAEHIGRAALEAVLKTNRRAIFLTGWGGWQPATPLEKTLFLDAAPHDWLFPRCHTIVHHGGAGTTAAALRAGVPSIIVPHAADQPFWGSRVAAIGAGPAPIQVKSVSTETMTQALIQADSDPIRRRAHEVGQLIQGENGVEQAVTLIEKHAESFYNNRSFP
jgi:sterol 3beta-glucosyltransferase